MTLQTTGPADVLNSRDTDKPEPSEAWALEAPLRLVAWALGSVGRPATTSAIREKLEGRLVHDPKWETWWKRVWPALKESGEFKVGKNHAITLYARVADVSSVPWDSLPARVKATRKGTKKKAATAADWRNWFEASDSVPLPGQKPTKVAFTAIDKLPSKSIELALDRAVLGADEYLKSGKVTPDPSGAWLELVSRAFCRFRELVGPDGAAFIAPEIGALLASLALASPAKEAGFSGDAASLMLSAGALPGEPLPWQRRFIAGMWQSFRESSGSAGQWLEACFPHVHRSARAGLARGLVAAALGSDDPVRHGAELDRILDVLSADERLRLFRDLIVRAASGEAPKQAVLEYLANSRHANAGLSNPAQRLGLSMMASILLSDGEDPATHNLSQEISDILMDPSPSDFGPVWSGLFSQSRQRLAERQAQHEQELERQRQAYEGQLQEERQEKERLSRRVEGLRAQIAEGRELSKMDILEDILMVTAETLQTLHQQKESLETLLPNAKAKLSLALGAGGAKEFGTVGEIVPYDPRVHHAGGPTNTGAPVRISVPGAIMHGNLTSSRVLTQAQVVQLSEVG